jgi:hypothetical protein
LGLSIYNTQAKSAYDLTIEIAGREEKKGRVPKEDIQGQTLSSAFPESLTPAGQPDHRLIPEPRLVFRIAELLLHHFASPSDHALVRMVLGVVVLGLPSFLLELVGLAILSRCAKHTLPSCLLEVPKFVVYGTMVSGSIDDGEAGARGREGVENSGALKRQEVVREAPSKSGRMLRKGLISSVLKFQ